MKLIRTKREKLVFEISLSEKCLLFDVLKLYPLISPTHHRLTKSARTAKHDENQRLLEESLAAQREENRKNVRAMLDEPGRFQAAASAFDSRSPGRKSMAVAGTQRCPCWKLDRPRCAGPGVGQKNCVQRKNPAAFSHDGTRRRV